MLNCWKSPVPFLLRPTQDRDFKPVHGEACLPLSPHPGAFGVQRKHHVHEGVDLYCPAGTAVCAVEQGTTVAIIPFTGPEADPPSPWWQNTWAVLVEGESGVVVYGELFKPNRGVGELIRQGEEVGAVKQVLLKDKGYSMSMLHLELHELGTRTTFDWINERPKSLLDPTPFLESASPRL